MVLLVFGGLVVIFQAGLCSGDKARGDIWTNKLYPVQRFARNGKYSYHSNYGNEIWQELRWIFLSRNMTSNSEYLKGLRNCLNSAKKYKCSAGVHSMLGKTLVGQLGRKEYLPDCFAPDCKYIVTNLTSTEYYLEFILVQQGCISYGSNISVTDEIKGGSSFEIVVRNNNSISSCSTTDFFNDLYHVFCPIQSSDNDDDHAAQVHLSILLIHEHFEGLAELIKCDLSSVDNRAIILDNAIINVPVNIRDKSSTRAYPKHNAPLLYSASWHVGECRYKYLNFSIDDKLMIQSPPPRDDCSTRLESLNEAIRTSNTFFYWTIEKSYNVMNEKIVVQATVDNSSVTYDAHRNLKNDFCISPNLSNHTILFVGDSHMRGFFDYFIARSIYARNLAPMKLQHGSAKFGSLSYVLSMNASEQALFLTDFCNSSLSHSDNKTTIFINTGHWDLTFANLRNLIHDQGYGQVLVNVLRGILQGDIPCKGLRQIVWLTATPYPICANSILQCRNKRGLRSNANLRALNEFYLQNILRIKPLDGIRLSVVDVFNIIYPRIFLRELEEVVCNNHFICRELLSALYVTPGGMAAIGAIEHSVCPRKEDPLTTSRKVFPALS